MANGAVVHPLKLPLYAPRVQDTEPETVPVYPLAHVAPQLVPLDVPAPQLVTAYPVWVNALEQAAGAHPLKVPPYAPLLQDTEPETEPAYPAAHEAVQLVPLDVPAPQLLTAYPVWE